LKILDPLIQTLGLGYFTQKGSPAGIKKSREPKEMARGAALLHLLRSQTKQFSASRNFHSGFSLPFLSQSTYCLVGALISQSHFYLKEHKSMISLKVML